MKSYKIYFTAIVLLFASCSSNDEITDNRSNFPADKAVRIATTVNKSLQTKSDGVTPATKYTGTDLGLSIDCTADDAYDYDNQKWSIADDGTTWTTLSQMLWKNATATNNIFAYAPYDAAFNATSYTFSAQQDQSSSILSSDFVTYKSDEYIAGKSLDGNQAIAVTFNHKMAKLKIVLTNGNQYTEDQLKNGIITVNAKTGISYTKSKDIATESSDATLQDITACKSTDAGVNEAQVVIAPQSIESGKRFIKFVMTDPAKTYYFTTSEEYNFLSGDAYTLNIKIGKDKLELSNKDEDIKVGSWNDQSITGGEAEFLYYIDKDKNEILLKAPGKLTSEEIATAINKTSGYLKISGPMNNDDIFTLRDWAYDNEGNAICLKDLDMSEVTGLTALPDSAFSPERTEESDGTFTNSGISSLTKVTLPESVTTIGAAAFQLCEFLTSVNLDKVKNINNFAFSNCSKIVLSSTSLSNAEVIGACGFQDCSSLGIIDAPKLKILADYVFCNCGTLSEINLPEVTKQEDGSYGSLSENKVTGDINLPKISIIGMKMFDNTSASTVHLTTKGDILFIAGDSVGLSNSHFNEDGYPATILYLNIDKKDGSAKPSASEYNNNSWECHSWNNIYYLKADGSYVDYDGKAEE